MQTAAQASTSSRTALEGGSNRPNNNCDQRGCRVIRRAGDVSPGIECMGTDDGATQKAPQGFKSLEAHKTRWVLFPARAKKTVAAPGRDKFRAASREAANQRRFAEAVLIFNKEIAMGWNTGYTIFESTVVGAYDLGKLDKELLAVLMEPYRGTDIDSGGCSDLESKDGKDVEQIVIEVMGGAAPAKPADDLDDAAMDDYFDAKYEAFQKIAEAFGWS